MKFPFEKNVISLSDTQDIAEEFSEELKDGNIIVLNGNLGSGKTTFVKLFCDNLGISDVSSPSFSIVNQYEGKNKVYHFDFYRINKIEELYDIGFEEYMNDCDAITFIEWGNLMPEILPSSYYEITILLNKDKSRTIKIRKN